MHYGIFADIFLTLCIAKPFSMLRRIATYTLLSLSLISCHEVVEPRIVAGYIATDATEESLTIVGDTIAPMTFRLDEATLREGGALVEGNVVEVIYLPADEGTTPWAERVTADKTYPDALGRWATDKGASVEIDIELQPHGRVAQRLPDKVMQFERWQITGIEDEIALYGTLSLPPDWSEYIEARKWNKDVPLPERRIRRFSIVATLDKETDNNTESRRVLRFKNNGQESKLYFQE